MAMNPFRGVTAPARGSAPARLSTATGGLFLHQMQPIDDRIIDHLYRTRRPADDDTVNRGGRPETVVDASLVLRTEAGRRGDDLSLLTTGPVQLHAGAYRAAVAGAAFELELNPVAARRNRVA